METGASDLGDVLLHCEFVVDDNSKVSDDVYWLDDVTADRECDVSAGQLLKTLPRINPHELRLQNIELQPTRSTSVDHISDAVTKAPRSGLDFGNLDMERSAGGCNVFTNSANISLSTENALVSPIFS